jgi:hypothetical protein
VGHNSIELVVGVEELPEGRVSRGGILLRGCQVVLNGHAATAAGRERIRCLGSVRALFQGLLTDVVVGPARLQAIWIGA